MIVVFFCSVLFEIEEIGENDVFLFFVKFGSEDKFGSLGKVYYVVWYGCVFYWGELVILSVLNNVE